MLLLQENCSPRLDILNLQSNQLVLFNWRNILYLNFKAIIGIRCHRFVIHSDFRSSYGWRQPCQDIFTPRSFRCSGYWRHHRTWSLVPGRMGQFKFPLKCLNQQSQPQWVEPATPSPHLTSYLGKFSFFRGLFQFLPLVTGHPAIRNYDFL